MTVDSLLDWLRTDAWSAGTLAGLIAGLGERLDMAGLPVGRLRLVVRSPHPLVPGAACAWSLQEGAREEPVPDGGDDADAREGREPGADLTLPAAVPGGAPNALELSADRPGGFSDTEIAELHRVTAALAPLLEVHAAHRTARGLMRTYLGRETGDRVLDGTLRRGDGETIHAVIWFCDVRDSTAMSEAMTPDAFLRTLNAFFECMAGAVLAHGGEVLSYVGDGMLAIFPIGGSARPLDEACTPTEGACARALAAARDARGRVAELNRARRGRGEAALGYGLALHVGDVMYGNVGVPGRLELTVIGAAANEAARLQGLCRELGRPIVISSLFPRCFPDQMVPLGRHRLRGMSAPQEVFTLADAGEVGAGASCAPDAGCGPGGGAAG